MMKSCLQRVEDLLISLVKTQRSKYLVHLRDYGFCKQLSPAVNVNVTLIFSPTQAILSAKAGAKYVSPFVGRVDDNSFGGLCLIKDIANVYTRQNVYTEILAASIRNVRDVGRAFEYGANVCTIPPKVFDGMYKHILTDKGLELFDADWATVCDESKTVH